MKFTWEYKTTGGSIVDQICSSRQLSGDYFKDALEALPKVTLMKDLEEAATLILESVALQQKIIIFGHDDLDGVTSTYILYDYLLSLGAKNVLHYLPNRMVENHGIQNSIVQKAADEKADLLITVDGCSSSFEGVRQLNELNCKVIITDHHLVPSQLPEAELIVNPKQTLCSYPYKMLAGVGVTLMLMQAMADKTGRSLSFKHYFWTALGTLADRAPMTGVNRIISSYVMKHLPESKDENIIYLKEYFQIGKTKPELNRFLQILSKILSSGRESGGNHKVMEFLLGDADTKKTVITFLDQERKDFDTTLNQLVTWLKGKLELSATPELAVVYYDKESHIPYNFLGACTSILTNHYQLPVFLLSNKDGLAVCEARTVSELNLVDVFHYTKDCLLQFGGHKKAAGFSAEQNKVPQFEEKLLDYLEKHKNLTIAHVVLHIDAVMEYQELAEFKFEDLNFLLPYGEENREPKILVKNYNIPENRLNLHIPAELKYLKETNLVVSPNETGTFLLVDWVEHK